MRIIRIHHSILLVGLYAALLGTNVAIGSPPDLGVYGTIFPIEEVDIRQEIKRQLRAMHWSAVQHAWFKQAKKVLLQSPTLKLKQANKNQCDFIDPSVHFKTSVWHDINPLDYVKPRRALVFIDGDDLQQVHFASRLKRDLSQPVIIIVAKGNYRRVRQYMQRHYHLVAPIYRADPKLIKRFHIQVLPSLLYANLVPGRHNLTRLSLVKPYHFNWSNKEALCAHAKQY